MRPRPRSRAVAALAAVVFAFGTIALLAPAALAQPAKAPPKEKKLTPAQQKRADEIARKMRVATLLVNSGDFAYAVKEAGEVLKVDKKHAEARRLLATAYLRLKQHDKAVAIVEALAKEDPKDYWAAATRAELYEKLGDRAKSLAALEALAERREAPPLVRFKVAMLLDDLRQKGDAAATEKVRKHLAAFLAAGGDETSEGKQALKILLEIEHGPVGRLFFDARESYFTAYKTGGIFSRQSMGRAEDELKKVLQMKPGFQPAHFFLGMSYASVKSPHYDLAAAEKQLRLAPEVPEAWLSLGRLLRDAERFPEAMKAFDRAFTLKPGLLEAGYQLGIVQKAMGRKADAVRTLEKVVMTSPASAAGSKALLELQAIAPNSFVTRMFMGRVPMATAVGPELFSTERFRAGIDLLERFLLGGVEEGADAAWLEKMLRRIVETNDLSTRVPFRVKIARTRAVNACAVPNGNVYFTRGFLDFVKRHWPKTPLDENNPYIAGVMAHELTHVVKGHVVNREMFMNALQQTGKPMDPAVFILTTRLTEIEADREAMVYTTVAGYQPGALMDFLEQLAKEMGDTPPMVDHPTNEERVRMLADFWTNDVRYAYQAFETGTTALEEARKAERQGGDAARERYTFATQEFDRFVRFFPRCKEVWNNLGVAQAKLGVMEMGDASPLSRWYTPLSIEKTLALKLKPLARNAPGTRGAGDVTFLNRARESLKKALAIDPRYARAKVNLAAAHIGLGAHKAAESVLFEAEQSGVDPVIVKTLQGIAAAEQQKWVEAIAAFDRAAGMPGATAAPLYCLGQARLKRGDPAGAARAFTKFVQVEGRGSPWTARAEAAIRDAMKAPK
jgi:predicted Zn-dependent protease